MPIITSQREKQRNLIIIFVLILFTIVMVLYLGVFRGVGPAVNGVSKEPELQKSREDFEIKLDSSLFKDEKFLSLVPYGKIVQDVKIGRGNPFLPYSQ